MRRKSALITGATSGIGAAFARYWAACGYNLIITGRRAHALNGLAETISAASGAGVEVFVGDLADAGDREALVELITARDDLEVLINNAGFGSSTRYPGGDLQVFREMVAVHIQAAVELVYAVVPQMTERGSGTIINVSSLAAFAPLPSSAIYCGTKAFLVLFSESLAAKLKHGGIRVQALCPGLTKTDFHRKIGMADAQRKNHAFVRWMEADDVVRLSIRCLRSHNVICVPGFWNKVTRMVVSLVPRRLYYRVVTRALK